MRFSITLFALFFILLGHAQQRNFTKHPLAEQSLEGKSFFEIQEAVEAYTRTSGLKNGKIKLGDDWVKVPGWKRYKRWEWYWESRVDRQSGAFPSKKKLMPPIKKSVSETNFNGDWKFMGPEVSDGGYAGIGRINCVAFHPTNNSIFWVGAPSGGIWRTLDYGHTWQALSDENKVLGVSDIAIPHDFESSNTLYIATGDRDGGALFTLGGSFNDNNSVGVLKSTNGGLSWEPTGLTFGVDEQNLIGRLVIHPSNSNVLFAGFNNGISKSTDGGAHWTTVDNTANIIDLEFKPGSPTIMYASTKSFAGDTKILRTIDGGGTWSTIKQFDANGVRVEMAVTPNDPNFLYAIVSDVNQGLWGIYKSIDGGDTFETLVLGTDENSSYLGYYSDGSGANNGQGNYDLCIAASPDDKNMVFIGGVNTWKTTDGGATWNVASMWTAHSSYNKSGAPEVHADHHTLAFRTDGMLFNGNDGGIYMSPDLGNTWEDLSNGLGISQMYRLGVSQTNPKMVIAGLQDNGTKLYSDPLWTDVKGGDGMECLIDYSNPNIQYATFLNGEIERTLDAWASSGVTISENIGDGLQSGAWVSPYVIDPNNASTLLVAYDKVWKTTDRGGTFVDVSPVDFTSDFIRSLAIAPSNSNYIYAADYDNIWRTVDGGNNWSLANGNLPEGLGAITYLAVDHEEPNRLWITLGGYDNEKVFESLDGGVNWLDISNGLPPLPVMSIVQNKQAVVQQLYVGTDAGVYIKEDAEDWELFSQGLPNVVVTELEIYYDEEPNNSKLRAATYGRGLWQTRITESIPTKPQAMFRSVDSLIYVGDTARFINLSVDNPKEIQWTFEGGIPLISNDLNPKVKYNIPGSYNVKLKVSNGGGSDSLTVENQIVVQDYLQPIVGFTSLGNAFYEGQNIHFIDTSENLPETWDWSFTGGDIASSNLQNPIVKYDTQGTYEVGLTVANSAGSANLTKPGYIVINPIPAFPPPINLQLTSQDSNAILIWETPLGDTTGMTGYELYRSGLKVDTLINPVLTQFVDSSLTPGNYYYKLKALYNISDESVLSDSASVQVFGPLKGGFTADVLTGNKPLLVNFTDTSINANAYFWQFGDGAVSYEKNPSHTYNKIGSYRVILYAFNEVDMDSVVKQAYITVETEPVVSSFTASNPVGDSPLSVEFINESLNADKYKWDFGDGTISFLEHPVHTFSTYGYQNITLVALNNDFSDTLSISDLVLVVFPEPVASFTASPLTGESPLEVRFNNVSTNGTNWFWDFGDETTSTDKHPVHVFSEGSYSVSLIASNLTGKDTLVLNNYINVWPTAIEAAKKGKVKVFPNPAHHVLHVELNQPGLKDLAFYLFDLTGKMVWSEAYQARESLVRKSIDLTDMEKGYYFLRIQINGETKSYKIAVQ